MDRIGNPCFRNCMHKLNKFNSCIILETTDRVLGIEITVQLSDSSVSFETKLSVQLGVGSFEHTPERYDMMSPR